MVTSLFKMLCNRSCSFLRNVHYVAKRAVKHNVKPLNIAESSREILQRLLPSIPNNWQNTRAQIVNSGHPFTPANVDYITMCYCVANQDVKMGRSYLQHLKHSGADVNLATIGQYFRLVYLANQRGGLSKEDQAEILELCDSVKAKYPVLDTITCENIILALSLTDKWKECLSMLKEVKLLSVPNALCYSAIVSACMRNKSYNLAWQLFREMLDKERQPTWEVFLVYLDSLGREIKTEDLEMLFELSQEYDLLFSEEVAKAYRKSIGQRAHLTNIGKGGLCYACKKTLGSLKVTPEEFNNLKKHFLDNAIVGKDIFRKTSPQELERFKDFVTRMHKHDVVVDGLNVAYSSGQKSHMTQASLVAAVVNYFTQQNKKVLVFGRKHMSTWPKKQMAFIKSNASLFLTDDLSQDDPYLLYCALHCGLDTIIVTRDLMRSHKFLLKTPYYKLLFKRWFAQNQYQLSYVNKSGIPSFKCPLPYLETPQKIDNIWHIPYSVDGKNTSEIMWMCIDT